MEKFKFLEHTADIKFQAFGENLEKAFENAALALKKAISGETEILEKEEKKIRVEGKDFESLLYNFLEEFLFLVDAEDFLLSKVINLEISKDISDKESLINKKKEIRAKKRRTNEKRGQLKLKAIISGDKANNYELTNKVKAITYNEMFVKKQGKEWVVQVVLDV